MCAHREIIKFDDLYECTILKRLSKFVVLVEVGGSVTATYINNTGRLHGYIVKGNRGYCVKTRCGRLEYRIIGVEDGEHAALIDTMYQEKAFMRLQEQNFIPWLRGYVLFKRNYKLGTEVIDFAYKRHKNLVLVELKSAVMKLENDIVGYPDAPTIRGRKQIRALAEYAKLGGKAIVVFVAGVPRAQKIRLYCCVDKEIGKVVEDAVRDGVLFKAMSMYLNPTLKSVILANVDIPVELRCD